MIHALCSPAQPKQRPHAALSRPVTILVSSGGTAVGKVVLDALEGRRQGVRLVACNAAEDSPNLHRFDAVHVVPLTGDAGWEAAVTAVIACEAPAVVIPGRDTDVEGLARLAPQVPALARAFMGGSPAVAQVFMDKALTARFAAAHGLAYAPTVSTDAPGAAAAASRLVAAHGFPLIAKPARGSGSLGVRILTCDPHLHAALAKPGMVIQPFLDCPPPAALDVGLDHGVPLFWDVPEDRMYSVQFSINREGAITGSHTQRARLVRGRIEEFWAFEDAQLHAVGEAFAQAAIREGWRGPLNVQAKRAAGTAGGWQVIELNGRFSGGTACRLWLGCDEVADMINEWVGRPVVPAAKLEPVVHVVRLLSEFPMRSTK